MTDTDDNQKPGVLASVKVGDPLAITFHGDCAPEFVALASFCGDGVVRARSGTPLWPGPHCDARFHADTGRRVGWAGDGGCSARPATEAEVAAHRARYAPAEKETAQP